MNMKYMEAIKGMLEAELETIVNKGGISRQDLDTVQKITSSIKNVDKIKCLEEDEYSQRRMSREPYSRRSWSEDDMSYADYINTSGIGHTQFVNDRYSRSSEKGMIAERIQHMIDENRMSGDEKTTLRKALEMLR